MAPGSAEKNSHKQLMPKLASNVATATCRAEILTLDVDLTWPAAHGAKIRCPLASAAAVCVFHLRCM